MKWIVVIIGYLGFIIVLVGVQLIISFIWNLICSAFDGFQIRLKTDIKNIGGKKITIIYVKGQGILPVRKDDSSTITYQLTVWDITGGRKSPVLCFMPGFQRNGLYFLEKIIPVPYERTVIKEWVDLGFVFPEVCVFPKSKNRDIEVHMSLLNSFGAVVRTYSSKTQFYNEHKGYEEIKEDKIKILKIKIQILVKIAMADGKFDDKERYFLSKKIEEFLEEFLKNDEKNDFIKEIMELSYRDSSDKSLYSLLSFFNEETTKAEKYNLIKTCVEMMCIDKEINEKELEVIDKISDYLNLDYKKINELKDIHILKGSHFKCSTPESVLGISSSWSYTHIHSHLRKEFVKWNSRMQNCSDKKEREHIQYMLDLISEMRLKYEKKAG